MTTWTERSSPPSTVWRRIRSFFCKGLNHFHTVEGKQKGRLSFKKTSINPGWSASEHFYVLQAHDGSTVMKQGNDNFYRVTGT